MTDRFLPPTTSDSDKAAPVGWQAPLADLLLAVVRGRWWVIAGIGLGLVLGVAQLATTPKTYKSSAVAVLLPREKPIFDAAVDSGTLETNDDGARREATGALMLPANPDLYTTILTSRAVLESLATRFESDLTDDFVNAPRSGELISRVRGMVSIETSEEGMMHVTVTDTDPTRAALIANAFVEEGERSSREIERGLIEQQVVYIDHAVKSASDALEADIAALKEFTAKHGVIRAEVQAADRLRQVRDLTARRTTLEQDLAARLVSYTRADPGVRSLQAEIDRCTQHVAAIEAAMLGSADHSEVGSLLVDHETLVDRVRRRRDLVVSLSAKADVLRIRAEQPAGNLAMVRPAAVPSHPAGPSKKLTLGTTVGFGLILGIGVAMLRDQWSSAMRDPYTQTRVHEMASALPKRLTRGILGDRPTSSAAVAPLFTHHA